MELTRGRNVPLQVDVVDEELHENIEHRSASEDVPDTREIVVTDEIERDCDHELVLLPLDSEETKQEKLIKSIVELHSAEDNEPVN